MENWGSVYVFMVMAMIAFFMGLMYAMERSIWWVLANAVFTAVFLVSAISEIVRIING